MEKNSTGWCSIEKIVDLHLSTFNFNALVSQPLGQFVQIFLNLQTIPETMHREKQFHGFKRKSSAIDNIRWLNIG
jgi:hypothetical protein